MKPKVLSGFRILFSLTLFSLIIFLGCSSSSTVEVSRQVFTFSSGKHVFVSPWPEGKLFQVAEGSQPSLSYKGRYLAYSTAIGKKRRIGITDLKMNRRWIIEDIHGACFQPQWSPHTDKLLFSSLINQSGRAERIIVIYDPMTKRKSAITSSGTNLYHPTWGADGQSVLAHNTQNLFEWNLKGKLQRTFPLKKVFGPFQYASIHSFRPSDNYKLWVFEAYDLKANLDSVGQQASVFLFDVKENQSRRITPDSVSTRSFCWGPDQQSVIVSVTTAGPGQPQDHYRIMEYSLQGELLRQWPGEGLTPGYYKITSLIKK